MGPFSPAVSAPPHIKILHVSLLTLLSPRNTYELSAPHPLIYTENYWQQERKAKMVAAALQTGKARGRHVSLTRLPGQFEPGELDLEPTRALKKM